MLSTEPPTERVQTFCLIELKKRIIEVGEYPRVMKRSMGTGLILSTLPDCRVVGTAPSESSFGHSSSFVLAPRGLSSRPMIKAFGFNLNSGVPAPQPLPTSCSISAKPLKTIEVLCAFQT